MGGWMVSGRFVSVGAIWGVCVCSLTPDTQTCMHGHYNQMLHAPGTRSPVQSVTPSGARTLRKKRPGVRRRMTSSMTALPTASCASSSGSPRRRGGPEEEDGGPNTAVDWARKRSVWDLRWPPRARRAPRRRWGRVRPRAASAAPASSFDPVGREAWGRVKCKVRTYNARSVGRAGRRERTLTGRVGGRAMV